MTQVVAIKIIINELINETRISRTPRLEILNDAEILIDSKRKMATIISTMTQDCCYVY